MSDSQTGRGEQLPGELQALIDAINRCEREAEALVADLSQSDVNWRSAPSRWSVGQCLDHLAVINTFYLRDFPRHLENAKRRGVGPFRGLSSTVFGRWFIASLEPPAKTRQNAPKQVVPHATVVREELVPAFKASHEIYRALVRDGADIDVNRVKGPNPFIRLVPMRLSTVLQIVPAHNRRHLWQAQKVKKELRG